MTLARTLVVAATCIALAGGASAQKVRSQQRVNLAGLNTGTNNHQDGIALAGQGNRLVIVWTEQTGTTDATNDIYFSRSDDLGLNWSPMTRIDLGDAPNQSDSDEPKVAIAADGTIVSIFEDKKGAFQFGSTNEDLYYNRSTDGGANWMASALPVNGPTSGAHVSSDIDRAWISATGNRLYVTWEEDSTSGLGGAEELWFTSSPDAGASWTAPKIVSMNPPPGGSGWPISDVDDPKVAADGLSVVIAFIDETSGSDDVRVLTSIDGGASFAGQVIETSVAGDTDQPQLARDGSLVAAIWRDADTPFANDGLHVAVSQDGGATWAPEQVLAAQVEAQLSSNVIWHTLDVRGDNIYVAYAEDSQSVAGGGPSGQAGAKVYVAVSNDKGVNWTRDIALDPLNPRRNHRPSIVATDSSVFVHLETGTDSANTVAYALSGDFGATWSPVLQVLSSGPDVDSDDPQESRYFVASGAANVAVSGYWDRPLGRNELYVAGIEGPNANGVTYCTAKTGLACGTPSIGVAGEPSASGTSGFVISAANARSDRLGVLLYSANGRANILFPQGGHILCISATGLRRGGPVASGGTSGPNCDGVFTLDMNAFASGNYTPPFPPTNPAPFLLSIGQQVNCQWWGRDSVATGSYMTDAVEYFVNP